MVDYKKITKAPYDGSKNNILSCPFLREQCMIKITLSLKEKREPFGSL